MWYIYLFFCLFLLIYTKMNNMIIDNAKIKAIAITAACTCVYAHIKLMKG